MPARRLASAARAALAGALLGALAQGCSPAPPPPVTALTDPLCSADRLESCEKRLAEEGAGRDLVAAYAAARAARDPSDPWARLWRELAQGDAKPGALLLIEGGAPVDKMAAARATRVLESPALPAPGAIAADELLLVMAGAAGLDHVIRARSSPPETTQLFPRDPLAPFLAGLRPVVRDDGTLAHLDADVALARAVRAAFDAASAFRYLDAAREASAIEALLEQHAPYAEPAVRARYALQLLGAAGLVLDAEEAPTAAAPPPPPPPRAGDTPYGSYLRVLTAKDQRREWDARATQILPSVAADRRDDLAALFARARDCDALRAVPMDGVRDLVFAGRLPGALARDGGAPGLPARAGQLPLATWFGRYEAMLRLVERTGSAWSYLPSLVYQRGEAAGFSPAGTATYRRVTELGLAHLAATKALEEAYPARYRAFTQLGLATAPGVLGDDKLRQALVKLTEASVQNKLAAAGDADAVLAGVATGALAGLSYPPALQEPHFVALLGAVTAKLRGDLRDKTGWGLAALHAADAVYRLAADQGPNPRASANQIARALAAPDVEHPALASLATAAARYAALAAARALDATVNKRDRFTPERRAARDGLRAALAGLGPPGEAPGSVLDDITELADGLIATVSTALAGKKAALVGAHAAPVACTPGAAVPLDPTTRRALARLGDVRRRILAHPRYREGDGVWVRRTRLLVTLLSDAMDLAIAGDTRKPLAFVVPAADARKAVEGALQELEPRAIGEAAAGAYALARQLAEAPSAEDFVKRSEPDLRRLAGGLLLLFRSDALGGQGPAMGVALLDALAGVGAKGLPAGDLMGTLVSHAGTFYETQQADQGDLCLLASLLLASLTHESLPPEAAALATRYGSRMAWALRFTREIHRTGPGETPDPALYAEGMRRATDDACQAPDADAILAVTQAIRDFAGGKRREARDALDGVLARADAKGLGVPRMTYRYEEKTATKVFSVTVDVSYGSGVLLAGNTFQLGLGLRSFGEPEGSLTATLAPQESPGSGEDAARYYVYTAALATVYHFVEGDHDRAVTAAQRAVAALTGGLKLGPRTLRSEHPAAWGADARELLVTAAQLAADAGMPFLAGDLWTVVRQGFTSTLDDRAVATMLDHPPLGLAGIKELDPVHARARRSLQVLAEPLPCTLAKVELGGYEETSCDAYPAALSLRIADALKKLPRLRRGADAGPHCAALRSLDAFLAGVDRTMYDPDAFTRAVEALRADDKGYDAAVLLTRQRHANHCSPVLVAAARALGRSPLYGPALRADLLSSAVNCTAVAGGPEVEADVLALDEETRRLPDPSRGLKLLLSIADLAARTDRWELLGKLAEGPDLVGRWMGVHPNAAAAALLIDHAVAAIRGQAVELERTKGSYQLLCETLPAADRAEMCATLAALRAPLLGPMAERQRLAKDAVRRLVANAATAPGKRP